MSYHEHSISGLDNEAPKRKRSSQESSTQEVAWTAARCNRLLRTITQRTAALRKILDNCAGNDANLSKKKAFQERRSGDHWSTTDPIWLPDAKRKAPCRTYTAKVKCASDTKGSKSSNARLTGLAFPSPFVRRVGMIDSSDPPSSPRPAAALRERPPPARLSRQLPIKPGSPAQEAEQGLVAACGSVLAATSSREPPRRAGARSLMGMCLRQVPSYIELNAEYESSSDFTSEIFEYLEQYGQREEGGWSGLRIVVRSQAVYLIRTAIADGLISADAIQKLVDVCSIQSAITEGQAILQTWLETTSILTLTHSAKLGSFGSDHGCQESTFRTIRLVGSQNRAKLALLCKRPGFWNEFLRSLADSSGHEAAGLLAHCVKMALEQEDQISAITSGVKELILKLTAMAASALLLGRKDDFIYRTMLQITADTAFSILEQNKNATILADIHSLVPLIFECALLLSGLVPHSYIACTTMTTEHLGYLSTIVQTMSQSRREDFAETIIKGLIELEKHLHMSLTDILVERILEIPSLSPLFQRVALAALTAKRQTSGDKRDEQQYQDLLKRLTMSKEPRPKTPCTPFTKNASAGFRWEDGICEWVAATPFTALSSATTACDAAAVPSMVDTPATETSCNATPDKENQNPLDATCSAAQHKIVFRPPPRAIIEQSPDVLAMTPQVKRPAAESPTIPAQKRARLSRTSSATSLQNGRRASNPGGTSQYSDVDESADELGF